MLADGTYDVVIIDAAEIEPDADAVAGSSATVRVELTVLAGEHKGEVLALTTDALGRDPLELLAAPGTLTVTAGEPHLAIEG